MEVGDRELLEQIAGNTSIALLLTTRDGEPTWANAAYERLTGAGLRPGDLTLEARPEDAPAEVRWVSNDGVRRWFRVACHMLMPNGNSDPQHRLLYEIADMTERRAAEDALRDREHRLARMEALAGVGTWEWDIESDEVTWSPELLSMFGYPPTTRLDYLSYRSLVHPDDVPLIEDTLAIALKTGDTFDYTHRMYLADRTTMRVFECHGEVTTDAQGQPVRVLGTAHDITEKRRVRDRLAFLAEHDPLTGLRNRRSITTYLDDLYDRDERPSGSLLLIDVDNFKDVNDLRGHAVGDQVMRVLGNLLREHASDDAVLGRLGGDEFAVVLSHDEAGDALAAADALRSSIARQPIVGDGMLLPVTASIGIALAGQAQHRDELLANADLALYEAKRAGRDRVELFAAEHYRHAADRVSEIQRVRNALDAGCLRLYAQPIVDLATRQVVSHEVLVRLHDGLAPPIGPREFMAAIERTDVCERLDRWVIASAISHMATAPARSAALSFAVNVSSRSLEDPTFAEYVIDTLHAADVSPARLAVEITETAAITHFESARQLVGRLSAAGCAIVLDDFGAGFGSFAHLKSLSCTAVKIAGESVRHADGSNVDSVIIDAVVRLAQGLGVLTVAQHVDREPLADVLRELGVDQAQGFHLGGPQPLADVISDGGATAGIGLAPRQGISHDRRRAGDGAWGTIV